VGILLGGLSDCDELSGGGLWSVSDLWWIKWGLLTGDDGGWIL